MTSSPPSIEPPHEHEPRDRLLERCLRAALALSIVLALSGLLVFIIGTQAVPDSPSILLTVPDPAGSALVPEA